MDSPKVSVVVPVYNAERYFQRCMDSVLGQTLQDIEVILVDDGSTDSSGRLCDQYAQQHAHVQVIHRENGGVGAARNEGILAARGEYIAFPDSDDFIDLDMYQTLYQAASGNGADAAVGGYYQYREEGIAEEKPGTFGGVYRSEEEMRALFLEVLSAPAPNRQDFRMLWRSVCWSIYSLKLIREHQLLFDTKLMSEDHLFNMEFFSRAQCVCVVERAFYYRCRNEQSMSDSYSHDLYIKALALYKEHLARMDAKEYPPAYMQEVRQRLQRNYLAYVRASIRNACGEAKSRGEATDIIAEICSLDELQAILREYPWAKGPLPQRLFNFGVRHRMPGYLYLLVHAKKAK